MDKIRRELQQVDACDLPAVRWFVARLRFRHVVQGMFSRFRTLIAEYITSPGWFPCW